MSTSWAGRAAIAAAVCCFGCGSEAPRTFTIAGVVSGVDAPVALRLTGPTGATATTDASGRYAFSGLPDGSYMITPSGEGRIFGPGKLGVEVRGADVPGQDFVARRFAVFPIPSGYSQPSDIIAGPAGDLWFVEPAAGAGRFGRITADGVVTEHAIATSGGLTGIAADAAGNVWFTELGPNRIARLAPDGAVSEFTIPGYNPSPCAIVAGPDGGLWFTEFGARQIGRIGQDGAVTEFSLQALFSSPERIAAGPDGNIWYTDFANARIGRMTPSGVVSEYELQRGSAPSGIVAGPGGALWFTEYGAARIGRITTDGAVAEFAIPGGQGPSAIAVGPDGNLWFTESSDFPPRRIGRITPAGAVVELETPPELGSPSRVVAGPDGNVWFTFAAGAIGRVAP